MSERNELSTAVADRADRGRPPASPPPPGRVKKARLKATARVRLFRGRVRAKPKLNAAWRAGIGLLGTLVLVVGVIAIPYPGPGWLIVFAGLGILATEFHWAGRVLRFARRYYDRWAAWIGRRHVVVQLLFGLATCVVVLLTLWLLGALAMAAGWVGLDGWTWLESPLLR